jgi:mannan endo-1,4-beta-mannosidase
VGVGVKVGAALLALALWALSVAGVRTAAGERFFLDRADGYGLWVPAGWTPDLSQLPVEARWTEPDATLRVFVQPVDGPRGAADYVSYSNRSVDDGWNGIRLEQSWQRGDTWFRQWILPAMPLRRPDEREYAEWDQVLDPNRVLTVMVNATPGAFEAARGDAEEVWRSVHAFPPVPGAANAYDLPRAPSRPPALVPRSPGLRWGIFERSLIASKPDFSQVDAMQAAMGVPLRVVLLYRAVWLPFPTQLIRDAARRGEIVELTLQSWAPSTNAQRALPYANGTSNLGAILQGRYDDQLRSLAEAAARMGLPFFLRWDNEMNGDWDPWSAFQWGKDADLYVAVWRHVHDIFQRAGATNAVWIWNPNNFDLPAYRWNAASLYYPGDAYVDWVGLTAYNLGDAQPGSRWQSFDRLYRSAYERDLALYPGKPLLITEFASHDSPGDKAAWVTDAVRSLADYPAIRYAIWWDADQGNLHYRLDQPPAALDAFRQAVQGALSQDGAPAAQGAPPPAQGS